APQGDGASAGDAAATPAPPPEAAAANQEFEAQVDAWNALVERLKPLQQQRDAASGAARAELETQIADMRRQTNETVDKIAEAGLRAYAAAPMAFPRVTSTLLAIAQFHVIGDAHGDGGDQYERALKICKGLIDAGAGEKWPVLYVLAGASAYNTGELDLAQQYLDKAESAGQFANVSPPRGDEPPAVKLLQDARQAMENLPIHRKHWDAERAIREAEAQADDLPRVKFTTNKGEIVIELFENEAPQSVANFITLVKQGYYNGVTFHRVLPLFMAQGGDPKGTGSGGPGYNIRDEQRAPKARRHFRGSLSMANTGQPNTGGSQFFLTFVPTSYLDGRHAVFGRVIQGMDVAASLKRRDPQAAGTKPTPDRILKAEVLRDRGHAYEFEKLSD
ncbi:MAG TPA: peptidylprolyl isomerase, partial [Lacipirellulaceae bacterium]|nr:peptidylprolyl isomerase [Lacipirellulaceae bacterium]